MPTHQVAEDPEAEFLYTVTIRRPLRTECEDGNPDRCLHDGTDLDACTHLEGELQQALPPSMYVHVATREPYAPPPGELLMRVETSLDRVRRDGAGQREFARLVYWTRQMQARKDELTDDQKRHAANLRRRVRRTIGL